MKKKDLKHRYGQALLEIKDLELRLMVAQNKLHGAEQKLAMVPQLEEKFSVIGSPTLSVLSRVIEAAGDPSPVTGGILLHEICNISQPPAGYSIIEHIKDLRKLADDAVTNKKNSEQNAESRDIA